MMTADYGPRVARCFCIQALTVKRDRTLVL